MRNATGSLANGMGDIVLNPSVDIYLFPRQDCIKECSTLLGDLGQMHGRHEFGPNKMVPDFHIWVEVLRREVSMRLLHNGPVGAFT